MSVHKQGSRVRFETRDILEGNNSKPSGNGYLVAAVPAPAIKALTLVNVQLHCDNL